MNHMWAKLSQIDEQNDTEMHEINIEMNNMKEHIKSEQEELSGILEKIKLVVNRDCMSRSQMERKLESIVKE